MVHEVLAVDVVFAKHSFMFYHIGQGQGSSFDREWAEHASAKHDIEMNKQEMVACYNVNQLLEMYLPKNQQIDFLDIDIEGADEKVLYALNWEKYKPHFVLLEMHVANVHSALLHPMTKFMYAKGYEMLSFSCPAALFSTS